MAFGCYMNELCKTRKIYSQMWYDGQRYVLRYGCESKNGRPANQLNTMISSLKLAHKPLDDRIFVFSFLICMISFVVGQ